MRSPGGTVTRLEWCRHGVAHAVYAVYQSLRAKPASWASASVFLALTAALYLSVVSAHAGRKIKYYNSQQQQQIQKQQQEDLKQQQEQQRAEQARMQQELQRQAQQMAERQRQMQEQVRQQQQQAQQRAAQEAARQQQLQRAQQQQMQLQAQQRSAQEADRQQQMQRAYDQQRQAQQRAQQAQQQAQQARQRRDDDDDDNNKSDDAPSNVADADADQDNATDPKRPLSHNERSRLRHRPNLPRTALELRPTPPTALPPKARPNTPDIKRPSQAQTPSSPATSAPAGSPPVLASPLPGPAPGRRPQSVEIAAQHLTSAEIERAKSLGFQPVTETVLPLSNTSVQQLRAPAGIGADQARAMLLQQMPLGKFAVNHTYHIFKDQEGEADKRAPSACVDNSCMPAALINWNSSLRSCTKDVRIGIIDTSFDLTHPAFRELKVSSGQFLGGEKPSQYDWHGTAVLSLLAGDPRSGTPGLIPDAHFLLATAFKTDASGNASTDSIRLVSALEWLEKLDVKYVNMSFSGPRDPMVEAIIQRMRREGVVFIAAAGNQGPVAPPSYPAAYPDVIAVTAVNRKGENYRHANRGAYIDVSAPGVDVLAALPDGKSGYRTGTSFAAPFVTAIVATQQATAMTTRAVWKPELMSHMTLKDLGPPGPDPIYGQGLALAPSSCTAPEGSGGTIAAGTPRSREDLPPHMGAGGPTIINTSGGAEAQ